MRSPLSTIINRQHKTRKTINILTAPTHERYQSNFAGIDARFFLWRGPGIKDWDSRFASLPDNHILLPYCNNGNLAYEALHGNHLPNGVTFDVVLSQHKFGQYQSLGVFSKLLHIPIISLEHTLPMLTWGAEQLESYRAMRSFETVFISEYSRKKWGYGELPARVIEHCVDEHIFSPDPTVVRTPHILTVANEYITRGHLLGFDDYQQIHPSLPRFPVGDTPGLSEPARTTEELVQHYRQAQVFLNTSIVSPIPSSLLEAAACGCAIVSSNNCMIPDIFTHGVDAFLYNNTDEMNQYLNELLKNKGLAQEMGMKAKATVNQRFNKDRFVKEWEGLFYDVANRKYTGVESLDGCY